MALIFRGGDRIFLPGACGEPVALSRQILGAPGVCITTSFVPGVNRIATDDLGEGVTVSGLFMHAGLSDAQREGRYRHLPMSYAATIKWLRESDPYDICVVQVSPPDADGMCSLGPAAEFTPEVLRRAGRIIAVVNPNVPVIPNAPAIPKASIAIMVESQEPLISYDVGTVDEATRAIARAVAAHIPDGAALQTGLGKVPHAIMEALRGHRGLRLHSGMLSDGLIGLSESGALDPNWPHRTTVMLGTESFYAWVAERENIHVDGVEITHDPARLAAIEGFVAVNSALEVDLFGQCNLELANGRAVSGSGGATDFARAARLSSGGLSIVALPATFGAGKGSRVRAWLGQGSIASLGRTEADLIVTEEGVADLRGLSVHERAEAIIAIARPAERAELTDQWRDIAARL